MDARQYYVRDRTAVQGPFDFNELERRVTTRRLARHHQVSTDRVQWRSAADALPELFQSNTPPPLLEDAIGQIPISLNPNPISFDDSPFDEHSQRQPVMPPPVTPIGVAGDHRATPPQPPTAFASKAVLALAIAAPLVVIGGLIMLATSGSPTNKSIAYDVGPCLATVQGIHPQNGKKECYALLVSRNQLVAPILAATLDALKVETRHKDGHTEWHSAYLLTADPVTGLCVLRADCGRDVTFMKLPESRTLPDRRASLRFLQPDPDSDQQIEPGTLVKVLNEGEPNESLQVECDDGSDALDDPLGRTVVNTNGELVGMVVGRLPDSTSLCTPAYEIRAKKKEAGKFPADHVLDRIDLPETPVPGSPPPGNRAAKSAPPETEDHKETDEDSVPDESVTAAKTQTRSPRADSDQTSGNNDQEPIDDKIKPSRNKSPSKTGATVGLTDLVVDAVDTAMPLPELSRKKAKELGDELRKDVLSKHSASSNQALSKRIRLVANSVLVAAEEEPDDYIVTVVEDDDVQAYAFVGNNIIMNTGFLDFAGRDDDMVRFVLAHEIGHLVKGHVEKPFRRELLAGRLAPGAPQVGSALNMVLKNSPYNQAEEEEADCFAIDIHRKKQWPLEGGIRFFDRIRAEKAQSDDDGGPGGFLNPLFSSHPDHERRIDLITNGCGS